MKKKKGIAFLEIITAAVLASSVLCMAEENSESITGKDGWYFSDYGAVADYQGTDLFTAEELETIKSGFKVLEEKLAEYGIAFVIYLAPNKENIYSEYMPDEYGTPAEFNRITQVYLALKDDFRVVCPIEVLQSTKAEYPQYELYYRIDGHWNSLGAYLGADELLAELGMALPRFDDLEISVRKTDPFSQGVADIPDDYYDVSFPGARTVLVSEQAEDDSYYHYYTEDAPEMNMSMFGDSFGMGMTYYLAQDFKNLYLHHINLNANESLEIMLGEEEPSVVVFEAVEKFIGRMLPFAAEMLAGN